MKTVIHVNRHHIAANKKDRGNRPVFTAKNYKENKKGNTVFCQGPVEFIYAPDDPLKCGAVAWAVTRGGVVVY